MKANQNGTASCRLPPADCLLLSPYCLFLFRRLLKSEIRNSNSAFPLKILLDQIKRQQQLRQHPLKRVIESGPSIQHATTNNQTIEKHRNRSNNSQPPNSISNA